MDNLKYSIEKAADLIIASKRIVVFTGAGISTESGIPDFRGKDGMWTKMDPEDFTIQRFLESPEIRKMQWQVLTEGGLAKDAEPNAAHYAILELEKLGKLDCIVTQNIDNLHCKAGNSPEKIFELHGNMQHVRCLHCNNLYPMPQIITRVKKEMVPTCENCGGILKPDVVFFGEALPEGVLSESVNRASQCDLCIVVGSTLIVYPAAYVPQYAYESGAKLIIINMGATPMDAKADLIIDGKAGDVLTSILQNIKMKMGK
jgi:NAD-dependent deacetylase